LPQCRAYRKNSHKNNDQDHFLPNPALFERKPSHRWKSNQSVHFSLEKPKIDLDQEDEDSPVKSNHKGFAFATKTFTIV